MDYDKYHRSHNNSDSTTASLMYTYVYKSERSCVQEHDSTS